jgi:starch-binding outer membrane protein, SusD/RagB family
MLPEDEVFSTPAGAQAVLDGVSRRIRSQASNSSPDDEFGQKGIDIKWDLMGEDITCTKIDWFGYDYQLDYRLAYWRRTREDWSFYYVVINNVNNIIVREDDIPFESDAQKAAIIGQALALRAYAYFNLINIYQFTYMGHENDPGVPVYTEPTIEGKGRGTVQDVYDRIVADLDRSLALMTANPSPRRHISDIDLSVTHGLYARVALQMGNWAKAESEAVAARSDYNLDTRDQFASGFSAYSKHNWMWGLETNKEQVAKYASFFSHMDMTIPGYAGAGYSPKYMSRALFKMLPDRDIRKQLCDSVIDGGKYYFVNYKFNATITGKFFAADYVMMRPEEMLLIQAEAIARQGGRDGDALALLDQLHAVRQTSPPPVVASGTAVLDSVLLERRFELWGEGFRGRDIKRLKIPLDRTGSDHIISVCMYLQLPAESIVWNYQIPQPEIDANPNISDADQNE